MALKDDQRRLSHAGYPFALVVPTRFGDLDLHRHLNNVAVQRLFEEGRVRFHRHLRQTHPAIGWPHFLVAHQATDFLSEGQYPDDVDVRLGVGAIGSSSHRLALGLFQNGRAFALADTVMVHRAAKGPGSAPLPEALRSALQEYALD